MSSSPRPNPTPFYFFAFLLLVRRFDFFDLGDFRLCFLPPFTSSGGGGGCSVFSFASPASKEAPIEQPKDNTQEPVALEIKEIEADLSFRKDLKNVTEIISVKIRVFDDSLISVSCGGSAYELEKCLGNKK